MSPNQYFATLQVERDARVAGVLFNNLLRPWKFVHQGDGVCTIDHAVNLIGTQLALTGCGQAMRKNGFKVQSYSIGKVVMSSEASDPLGLLGAP